MATYGGKNWQLSQVELRRNFLFPMQEQLLQVCFSLESIYMVHGNKLTTSCMHNSTITYDNYYCELHEDSISCIGDTETSVSVCNCAILHFLAITQGMHVR